MLQKGQYVHRVLCARLCKYAYFYGAMPAFTDQTGHKLHLNHIPGRIVSVVPSQSEFLWDIGLEKELVGITKFCIHPQSMYKSVTRVGGTKKLDIEKIRSLKPDLIIGNKEENEKAQIEELRKEFNVWMSDIYTLNDALEMMRWIGELTGKQQAAEKIILDIKSSLPGIQNLFPPEKVLYFIWKKPYMVAAKNTFIDYVLNFIGFKNAAAELQRYPELNEETLKAIAPDCIFLSSEPYPFKEKDIEELQQILPAAKILIVDGEMFSWYGSRLRLMPDYLRELKSRMEKGKGNMENRR